jgi:hypothetical protein
MVLVLPQRMALRLRLLLRVLGLVGMGMDSRRIIPIIKRTFIFDRDLLRCTINHQTTRNQKKDTKLTTPRDTSRSKTPNTNQVVPGVYPRKPEQRLPASFQQTHDSTNRKLEIYDYLQSNAMRSWLNTVWNVRRLLLFSF